MTGLVQLSALSHALGVGWVLQCAVTTFTPPPGDGSSQVTYSRPNVGLVGVVSSVICGLSCSSSFTLQFVPPCAIGRPTFFGDGVVPDGPAMRLTEEDAIRADSADVEAPGPDVPAGVRGEDRVTARISVSSTADPLTSNVVGNVRCDQFAPPSLVMLRPPKPGNEMSFP